VHSMRDDLGAFWHVELQAGGNGPLAGRTVAWKDCVAVAGMPRSSGAPFLAEVCERDATVAARFRAAGAATLGKLAMHQLAWGMMGQTPGRPPVRNPHDPTRIPGGSSSGSAVAVAAGLVDFAPGTDTGGSIRAPAAMCGVVGFKPSFGLLPLDGILGNSRSLDHVGPIARNVADTALAFDVMAGREPRPVERARIGDLRVGVLERHFCDDLDPGVERAFRAALEALAAAGATLQAADIGWQDDPTVLRDIFNCEPVAWYADGVLADPEDYEPYIVQDLRDGLATPMLQYMQSLDRLDRVRERGLAGLAGHDVVTSVTVPMPPAPIDGPDITLTANRNTKPFNALGWPTISVPCGVDDLGLPVGLQIAGWPGDDDRVLAVAAAVEAVLR
jgi:Asp-tRNA(Asn)/Glu-tRNA(Gln) amidotransferase A subunit family amidase